MEKQKELTKTGELTKQNKEIKDKWKKITK